MSVSTEKTTLKVTFSKEKLDALRFYMNEKNMTVENELQNHMQKVYEKYVPLPTRKYLERNDNGQEVQEEPTPRTTASRGRRGSERAQNEQEQVTAETINAEEIEESQEQIEEENQGMSLSM